MKTPKFYGNWLLYLLEAFQFSKFYGSGSKTWQNQLQERFNRDNRDQSLEQLIEILACSFARLLFCG